jgi:methyl-accepting chemotaxis protein
LAGFSMLEKIFHFSIEKKIQTITAGFIAMMFLVVSIFVIEIYWYNDGIITEKFQKELILSDISVKNIINDKDSTYSSVLRKHLENLGEIAKTNKNLYPFVLTFQEKSYEILKLVNERKSIDINFRLSVYDLEKKISSVENKELVLTLLEMRKLEGEYIIEGNHEYVTQVIEKSEALEEYIQKGLSTGSVENFSREIENYRNKFTELVENKSKIILREKELKKIFATIKPTLDEKASSTEILNLWLFIFGIIFTGIAIISGLYFSKRVGRMIIDRLSELTEKTILISAGEEVDLSMDTTDEIGQLIFAINNIVAGREELVRSLKKERTDIKDKISDAIRNAENQNNLMNKIIDDILLGLSDLATGNFETELVINSENNLAKKLYSGFNQTTLMMNDMIWNVKSIIDKANISSSEINQSTDSMAKGVEEQSLQVDKIATAIEEMTRTIAENAENATKTADLAINSGRVATEGSNIVHQTVIKIKDIASIVTKSTQSLLEVATSFNQINSIVSVVEDIARQTNLLALNAAIEAASAGEHGRGFSVVADEVRKLAERTSGATRQIADMITGVQTEMRDVVEVMKNGNNEVEKGIELADEAGEALKNILKSSENVTDMVNQIAAANEQQSVTSTDIARNIDLISSGTSNSVNEIKQIVDETDKMSNINHQLTSMIAEYKLRMKEA